LDRLRPLLLVAALAVAIGGGAYALDLFDDAELATIDARFELRGERDPHPGLALVLIDDVSFDALDEQWPFPRSLHARAIERLRRAGARSIAYDVQFTEPTEPAEDGALLDAVARMGGVTLATSEVGARGSTNVFGGDAVVRRARARAAHSELTTDRGATLRRLPLQTGGLKSFAVVAAEAATGEPVGREELGGGSAWIDYRGGPGTFPALSFSRVLEGRFDPAAVRGKTVVVGASAPTLKDVHPTAAGGGLMSGPEVQANAIATVLDGFPLSSAPVWLSLLAILALGLAVPAASLRLRPLPSLGLAVVLAVAYLALAQLLFAAGTIVPVLYPLLALLLAASGTLAVHYSFDAVERIRTRDAFARFAPSAVVDEVLASAGEGVRLGGVRREATVLFSDIRGFSALAEGLEPDRVIDVLNRYLTAMTAAIMDEGGTLVSYMGDGIMAVFGAPLEQADHAERALRAASEMLGPRLDAFNEWARADGLPAIEMGVGINSGPVMSGNVGSPQRMEYTAIGDTTNTAARLEAMTKDSGFAAFVSARCHELLPPELRARLREVGELEVRGRAGRIGVWGLESARPPR